MVLSSTKNKWEIHGSCALAETPWRWPYAEDWCRSADNPSAQKRNKKGEIGFPCLKPRVGIMWPWGLPFILTEYVTEIIHCIIRFTHLSLKPIFCMICFKQPHSTRSKALLISSFKAISQTLLLVFWFRWCIISKTTRTLSVMRRLDMNAL